MKNIFGLISLFLLCTISVPAENNQTGESNTSAEHNRTAFQKKSDSNQTKPATSLTEKQIKAQMEREKKYAKEQKFYQGDEYDFKAVEVNPDSLDHIPVIEPDYDFDITDVYRDDI